MLEKPRERTRKTAVKAARRSRTPELNEAEERILQKAQIYLLFEAKRPHLWTVADIREEKDEDGSRHWIIAVNLRYPTGFEGYLGDLLYDGAKITELTDLELMRERARQIAADPKGRRQWDELKASALRTGTPKHVRPGEPANGAKWVVEKIVTLRAYPVTSRHCKILPVQEVRQTHQRRSISRCVSSTPAT